MGEYLNHEDVEAMSMALRVYDVDQEGWEHENKGLEFNLGHVLKELVRARRKDFFDPSTVRNEVAPDAMQYALRIARWTGFRHELILPSRDTEKMIDSHARQIRTASRRAGAYAVSEIMLADFVHKLDHGSERQAAHQSKYEALPRVSQALTVFALDSASEFGFNSRLAFFDRLVSLRERFGVATPLKS